MKSVLLNEQGYTTDGKWRLVVVDPKPEMSAKGLCVSEAEHDPAEVYRAMITASPSPELAEAVPVGYFQKHPVTGVWEETVGDGVLLYAVPPAPAVPAVVVERLEGASIQARLSADANVLLEDGYSMRAANIKEAIERIAELEAENQELRADAERYRHIRGKDLETINDGGVFAGMTPDNIVVNGEDLDQVIDTEIAIDAAKGVDRG